MLRNSLSFLNNRLDFICHKGWSRSNTQNLNTRIHTHSVYTAHTKPRTYTRREGKRKKVSMIILDLYLAKCSLRNKAKAVDRFVELIGSGYESCKCFHPDHWEVPTSRGNGWDYISVWAGAVTVYHWVTLCRQQWWKALWLLYSPNFNALQKTQFIRLTSLALTSLMLLDWILTLYFNFKHSSTIWIRKSWSFLMICGNFIKSIKYVQPWPCAWIDIILY